MVSQLKGLTAVRLGCGNWRTAAGWFSFNFPASFGKIWVSLPAAFF
jgi:hypothetical protein